MNEEKAMCELCGEPMPKGEEMFKFHGNSGPCPKPQLTAAQKLEPVIDKMLTEMKIELMAAMEKFPKFNSAHEGFAVLKEEVDELWDEVKTNQSMRNPNHMQKEALQVSAMGLRFAIDVCCPYEKTWEK